MEITSKFNDPDHLSPLNSPTTTTTTTTTTNGIPISRSDPNNPYPTTFVTADTSSFKQVVQSLTGSNTSSNTKHFLIPPKKKQGFKLYERRNTALKNIISPLIPSQSHQNASFSPRHINKMPEILSPSLLDFPSLTLTSPVTPLVHVDDPFDKSSPSIAGSSSLDDEEERSIAEKGFFLHPSPISTPRDSEPQLLPLFPLSSPRGE